MLYSSNLKNIQAFPKTACSGYQKLTLNEKIVK